MTTKMITGVVERVLVRERESGADTFGNTHTRALQIGGQWFNFSGGTKPVWNVKIGDGFKVLGAGSEVAFKATTTVSKTNGKEYTNCSGLMVINLVEGENSPPAGKASQPASGGYTPKEPYDETGMLVCHGLNGAMALVSTGRFEPDNDTLLKLAKEVHAATTKLKGTVAKEFPDMNKKSVGNYSGNAVNAACLLVESTGDLYGVAYDYLVNVTMKMDAFIRAPKEEVKAPPAKITRAPAKKPATTKAQPVVEIEEEDGLDSAPF